MAKRPAITASQSATLVTKLGPPRRTLGSDRGEKYPGGEMAMPGRSRFTKYQKCSSYSARADSSVSDT